MTPEHMTCDGTDAVEDDANFPILQDSEILATWPQVPFKSKFLSACLLILVLFLLHVFSFISAFLRNWKIFGPG